MKYYSNGKLLLTGEYLVMLGAKAIAFPVKYGQSLKWSILKEKRSRLYWKAKELGKKWIDIELDIASLDIINTNSKEKAQYLSNILKSARDLNPNFLVSDDSVCVETDTNFPVNWGLGTSSTLINNIAQWAEVDPFVLHGLVSKGSGYDIACAGTNEPIIYQTQTNKKPKIEVLLFNKSFLDRLFFVYSGKKKSTEEHISKFDLNSQTFKKEIEQINIITQEIVEVNNLQDFTLLLDNHEQIISKVIQQEPISINKFVGFKGIIKSLGAWGGDFVLVATTERFDYVKTYFEHFGLSIIIPFREMVSSI